MVHGTRVDDEAYLLVDLESLGQAIVLPLVSLMEEAT